jgi:hypothetical protein
MKTTFSTREVADILGSKTWRVRRLYQDGTFPEPARFAGRRVITQAQLPAIVDALRARGRVLLNLAISRAARRK